MSTSSGSCPDLKATDIALKNEGIFTEVKGSWEKWVTLAGLVPGGGYWKPRACADLREHIWGKG
jgi:hypothetical protein